MLLLSLRNITKSYQVGEEETQALRGISLDFGDNEFVGILGPSGSGKTTLLNNIGGLDRYTEGDLVINGISTKEYTDKDWDAYRNHTVGFVFQSYNLIPHQTVLSNVELALTISGVSGEERKSRAVEALTRVGLKDHIDKMPNQLSGGQMQRVAIARALVNDPDIILADEPTGALDSKTSVQIMDLLKEVASDRLVIMVTHNPDLAAQYATRIIQLKDGLITDDSDPTRHNGLQVEKKKPEHTRLGFRTAFALSMKNLMAKKGRTTLTSFACSVGIIGIALILALSNGVNAYIKSMESNMLGSYPITIQRESLNLNAMMGDRQQQGQENNESMSGSEEADQKPATGKIQSSPSVADTLTKSQNLVNKNDLKKFTAYLQKHSSDLKGSVSAIDYQYDTEPQVYRSDPKNGVVRVYPSSLSVSGETSLYPAAELMGNSGSDSSSNTLGSLSTSWTQMTGSRSLRGEQYKKLAGSWPKHYNEVALVVDSDDSIDDYTLYTLGLMDIGDMQKMVRNSQDGKKVTSSVHSFSYQDLLGKTFQCFAPAQLYTRSDGVYVDRSDDASYMKDRLSSGTEVRITCVLRARSAQAQSGVAYLPSLTRRLMKQAADTEVVRAQLASPKKNVLTGKSFQKTGSASALSALTGQMTINTAARPFQEVRPERGMMYRSGLVQTAYAADSSGNSSFFSAMLRYIESVLQEAMMQIFQNVFSESQIRSMVEQYISRLSPSEKQALIQEFASSLSEEQIKDIAAQCSGNMSNAQMQKLIEQYLGNMSESQKEALVKQYASSMSKADMQKLAAQYLGGLSQADIRKLIRSYSKSMSQSQMQALIRQYVGSMDSRTLQSMVQKYLAGHKDELLHQMKNSMSADQIKSLIAGLSDTASTYDGVLQKLGYSTPDNPSSIRIYPRDFDKKQDVLDFIQNYNRKAANEDDKIHYTDLIATITKNITKVIDTISSVLIAFVAISLVVSSIMIAIITYISVLERTKEIGILRALGSSKHDVSSIFNAETILEGLFSGILGILITLLLSIPINHAAQARYNISQVAALPVRYALLLILISILLNFIAGYIPSRMAAKKDPVTALRTE